MRPVGVGRQEVAAGPGDATLEMRRRAAYLLPMQFLLLIVIGAAAGFVATRVMKVETGVLLTVAIGVVGAVVGAVLLRLLPLLSGFAGLVVGAVLGATLLIWAWKAFFR